MIFTPRARRLHRLVQVATVVAAILASGTAHAHRIHSERLLASIIRRTPASVLVSRGEQVRAAERAAAAIPGAEAMWGVGDSMEPLYASHTALVVAPIDFDHLEKGMTIVYRNRRGEMVAHSLTGDVPDGWIAQGINNDREDDDLVTRDNLIGVIVRAYSETNSDFRTLLAKQLIAKGRLPAGQS